MRVKEGRMEEDSEGKEVKKKRESALINTF